MTEMPFLTALQPPSPRLRGALVALVLAGGCAPVPDSQPTSGSEPWIVEPASPDTADGITILLYHDMEGLSGEDDPNLFRADKPEYARGQELLAADVNAVVEGLFAGGATEVHIVDGHGSGSPEPDLRGDLMDPRLIRVVRDEPFDAYTGLVEGSSYDAVGVIGMHAKTGSRGFASHTFTLGIGLGVNGRMITETELVALSWGRAGVPVFFASGDDRLEEDLETMPWIAFARVKSATSASTADLLPPEEAHEALRSEAERAVRSLASMKVMRLEEPFEGIVSAVPPASLAMLDGVPGIRYADETVTFEATDFMDYYRAVGTLIGVATTAYNSVMSETLQDRDDARAIVDTFRDRLFDRWLDVQSGRWEPPLPGAPAAPPEGGYFGYR